MANPAWDPSPFIDSKVQKRFWAKVARGNKGDCWLWQGACAEYGLFSIHGRTITAHRVAWMLFHGCPVPSGRLVLHRCDIPPCCNPNHLYLGDHRQNMRDRGDRGRTAHSMHQRAYGENNGRARLRWIAVEEIRRAYLNRTATKQQLADRFAVSLSTIKHITRGRTWRRAPQMEMAPSVALMKGETA